MVDVFYKLNELKFWKLCLSMCTYIKSGSSLEVLFKPVPTICVLSEVRDHVTSFLRVSILGSGQSPALGDFRIEMDRQIECGPRKRAQF